MATMDKLEQIQQTLREIDARVPEALRVALRIGYSAFPVAASVANFAASVLPRPATDDAAIVAGEDGDAGSDAEAEPDDAAPALRIRYGSCYVPLHDHDAHFGHADAEDAGAFSRGLMANALAAAAPACPRALLETAHERTAASGAPGASTAVILSLAGGALKWAYIGDSGFAVVRGGRIVCRSTPQRHALRSAPFQLCADPASCDNVDQARAGQMAARDGDVVVAGTDGLFDNISDAQLERMVQMGTKLGFSAKNMADIIAGAAYEASRALRGKPDDITVVVAFVVQPDS